MKQYTIVSVCGKPHWEEIPTLQVDIHNWRPKVDIAAEAQICYDSMGLYLHMRSWEKNVRAEVTDPLGAVCDDSCMEFFFQPNEKDPRYFNFEMNPTGVSYVGLCYDRDRSCRLAPDYREDIFQKKINRLPDGWEIFFTIPVSFIRVFFPDFELKPGLSLYGNCFKCGDLTEQVHYLSWSPCRYPEEDFHQTRNFGHMVLG